MIKDKKNKTLTFRLSEDEYQFLNRASALMGSTPSKFVRQLIQIAINSQKRLEQEQKPKSKELETV